MSDLVHRVATAIRDDYVARYPEEPPMRHAGPGQPVWRHMARAALAATSPTHHREPERTDPMAPSLISGGDDDPNPYNVLHLPDLPHNTDPAHQLRWDVDLDGDGDIAIGLLRGDELLACSAQRTIEGVERYAIRVLRNHLAVERRNQADR